MKLFHILILILVTLSCFVFPKKTHKKGKGKLPHVPSQYGRNYRKPSTDPSFNPLPKEYYTGPLTNFANHAPKKYRGYNRFLSHNNRYIDTTGRNAERGAGKAESYKLKK